MSVQSAPEPFAGCARKGRSCALDFVRLCDIEIETPLQAKSPCFAISGSVCLSISQLLGVHVTYGHACIMIWNILQLAALCTCRSGVLLRQVLECVSVCVCVCVHVDACIDAYISSETEDSRRKFSFNYHFFGNVSQFGRKGPGKGRTGILEFSRNEEILRKLSCCYRLSFISLF